MQIIATFEHSTYLELAITKLETEGFAGVYALPLDNRTEERRLFDTIHRSDGVSLTDFAFPLAVVFSVIGASRGFMLEWGPIYWGLIGAGSGLVTGIIVELLFMARRGKRRKLRGKHSEVVLIVECDDGKAGRVEEILWEHLALGVGKLK